MSVAALHIVARSRRGGAWPPALAAAALLVAVSYAAEGAAVTQTNVVDGLQPSAAYEQPTSVLPDVDAIPAGGARSLGPLRMFLEQPVQREGGIPIYRGYVENLHTSSLWNVRLEISFPDGRVATYPIASVLEPGVRTPFEILSPRPDTVGTPIFRWSMKRDGEAVR